MEQFNGFVWYSTDANRKEAGTGSMNGKWRATADRTKVGTWTVTIFYDHDSISTIDDVSDIVTETEKHISELLKR